MEVGASKPAVPLSVWDGARDGKKRYLEVTVPGQLYFGTEF